VANTLRLKELWNWWICVSNNL